MFDAEPPEFKELLNDEAAFYNNEWRLCFPDTPLPRGGVFYGQHNVVVEYMKTRIMHHYIDEMKKAIENVKHNI